MQGAHPSRQGEKCGPAPAYSDVKSPKSEERYKKVDRTSGEKHQSEDVHAWRDTNIAETSSRCLRLCGARGMRCADNV